MNEPEPYDPYPLAIVIASLILSLGAVFTALVMMGFGGWVVALLAVIFVLCLI